MIPFIIISVVAICVAFMAGYLFGKSRKDKNVTINIEKLFEKVIFDNIKNAEYVK